MMPWTSALVDHLWQSTLFAGVAWLATLGLRRNHPRVRYWLWTAASVKFLAPFSLLVAVGALFERRSAPPLTESAATFVVEQVLAAPAFDVVQASSSSPQSLLPWLLATIWALGVVTVMTSWWRQWLPLRAALRRATAVSLDPACDAGDLATFSSPSIFEPGVVGMRRPILLVPENLIDGLTPAQLKALIVHERCHVRHHDNLFAAIHMLVEALCWFHPLVWWIGRRMLNERERACDQAVLQSGSAPADYAAGILEVCRRCVASPLACVSGVTGAHLRARIESIMSGASGRPLTLVRRIALGCVAGTILCTPIAAGMLRMPRDGQDGTLARLQFEVASIRPNTQTLGMMGGDCRGSDTPEGRGGIAGLVAAAGVTPTAPGRCRFVRSTLKELVAYAYDVLPRDADRVITGGPGWMGSDRFDVEAKSETLRRVADMRLMLRSLLEDRFALRVRQATRDAEGYALVVAPGGHKLEQATGKEPTEGVSGAVVRGRMAGSKTPVSRLALILAMRLGRPVQDRTGLVGVYNFTLSWTPGDNEVAPFGARLPAEIKEKLQGNADQSGTSLFTALQEQLGLRLVAESVPSPLLIIENAERPSPN